MRAKDMIWPLWNLAWGGQRGFRTWDSLQSARKAAVDVRRAQRVRRMRVGVMGGREGMLLLVGWMDVRVGVVVMTREDVAFVEATVVYVPYESLDKQSLPTS